VGGTCDSVECDLTVNVTKRDPLEFDVNDLIFATTEDATHPPPSRTIHGHSPCGLSDLDWKVTVIDGSDWLSVDTSMGTGTDSVVVSIADQRYTAGIKHALLVFTNAHTSQEITSVYVSFFIEPGVDVGRLRAKAGSQVVVPINLYTKVPLSGFTIPLKYVTKQRDKVVLDSLVVDRNIVDSSFVISDSSIVIMFRPRQDPPVPESTYVVGNMYFTIAPDAQDETVPIRKVTVDYGGETFTYQFVDTAGVAFVPQFSDGEIVIGDTSHVTTFYAYPNPYNPDRDGLVGFVYPNSGSGQATVSIYDASMALVTERRDSDTWDGKNQRGEIVANGVYFYIIETRTGYRTAGKLAVLR
jgi:hypothetical protein